MRPLRLLTVFTLLAPSIACSTLSSLRPGKEQPSVAPAAAADLERGEPPALPISLVSADDYVVRVVAEHSTCTGTLIAEDLVLTAHHCVAQRDAAGDILTRDMAPHELRVELGGDYLPWGEVGVRAVLAPPCGHRAGVGDIAVLVLERKLVGVSTLTPELDAPPKLGDEVHTIGFGRCALSTQGVRRKGREGGAVEVLKNGRYVAVASICPGDSGGPALSREGALVGVVSQSAMDGSEETKDVSEFTRLDAFRDLFANARAVAGGASPAELPPLSGCPAP